jgi:hypothetical protein
VSIRSVADGADADLATAPALAAPHEHRPATRVKVGLTECQRFGDA